MGLIIIWHYLVYFFKLAYYQAPLIEFKINLAIIIGLNLGFFLIFIKKENQE